MKLIFILYSYSLFFSIAGMEIFSTMLFAWCAVKIIKNYKDKTLDIKKVLLPKPLNLLLLIFWILLVASGLAQEDLNFHEKLDIFGYGRWILWIYILKYAYQNLSSINFKLHNILLPPIFIISILTCVQFFTGIQLGNNPVIPMHFSTTELFRVKGFFGEVLTYSYAISFIFFYLLYAIFKGWDKESIFFKVFQVISLITIFASLFFTFTRGLWLGLFPATFLFLYFANKRLFTYLLISSLFAGILSYQFIPSINKRINSFTSIQSDQSNNQRIMLWKAYYHIFQDHRIFGVGFRNGSRKVEQKYKELNIQSSYISHAHNNYIEVLVGIGFLGLICYMLIMIYLSYFPLKHNCKGHHNYLHSISLICSYMVFHIGGLTQSSFIDGEVMHNFCYFTALFYSHLNYKGEM